MSIVETILIKNIYAVGQNKICDILIEDGKIKTALKVTARL